MIDLNCRILKETREFSGAIHRLVERLDGYRFYLDPAFLFALENYADLDLEEKIVEMGARKGELSTIKDFLLKSGLICEGDEL